MKRGIGGENVVDDRAVDATLGDETLEGLNTSEADTEQMSVQATASPIAVYR
jgi:hypothetical protein